MRRIFIFVLLICFVLPVTSCSRAPNNTFNINSVTNYTEIPGVTDEEINKIEALIAAGESFSFGHVLTTEAFVLPDGTYSGFVYEFCELLTKLFYIEFVPEYYDSWEELKSEFDEKTVDFNGDLTATPERLNTYYMTDGIIERSLRIFTNKADDRIKSEKDIENLTIGFLTGTITADSIKKLYPAKFISIDVDSFSDASERLRAGVIDAFVMEAIADTAFDEYGFIHSQEFFPLVYTPASLSTANPGLEPIITVVDKYLAAGGNDKLYELYMQCDYKYIKNKLNKSFTVEERAYIEELAVRGAQVAMAAEHDNYPISFYNEKDREFQGVAIEVLSEVSRLTGIEFFNVSAKDTSWAEIMAKLKSGEISMVSELVYSDSRAEDFIWAKTPTISSFYALLSKSDYPDLAPQQAMHSVIGVTTGTIYENMYNLWFPENDNLVTFSTQNEAFNALEEGSIDLMMATELMLYTLTNYREKPGYKVNMSFNTQIDSLFGFNKNETILRSIIDKTLVFVDISTIGRNWTNRTFDYTVTLANMRAVYLLIFSAILLITLIIVVLSFLKTKQLSKELVRQSEEAKVASKAKTYFLANMSHEIRTPLNAIIGMSNIAKNAIIDNEKAISAINQVISSSNHLLGVLNDVLDMSKIESGKLEIIYEPFSMLDAYGAVSGIIMQRCNEKHINFVTNINEHNEIILIGDKQRINQVLINLLGNAVKFTEDGGVIKLFVTVLAEDDKKVRIKFSVSDNGIGMSAEQAARLFIPFEQGNSLVSAKYGGTGLGLSISQNLINMMGGEIKVESRVNEGSEFYFELCFDKGEPNTQKSFDTHDSIDFTGKRILLVEDIDINRFIICDILSTTNIDIIEAEDGRQALEAFESSPAGYFNLIFMDIQMPVMNGYESAKRIRGLEREDAKRIPIIAMTANAFKEDVDESLGSGMDGHLSKPIDIDALIETLRNYIM